MTKKRLFGVRRVEPSATGPGADSVLPRSKVDSLGAMQVAQLNGVVRDFLSGLDGKDPDLAAALRAVVQRGEQEASAAGQGAIDALFSGLKALIAHMRAEHPAVFEDLGVEVEHYGVDDPADPAAVPPDPREAHLVLLVKDLQRIAPGVLEHMVGSDEN